MSQELVNAAIAASAHAYAPYSNFHVGAALLLDDGQIVSGANFENASYGMTLCAETVAIAKANSDGVLRNIVAIAVAGGPARQGGREPGGDYAVRAVPSDHQRGCRPERARYSCLLRACQWLSTPITCPNCCRMGSDRQI